MRQTKQQKIVKELFEEYKDKKEVIGIVNFGSVAVGKERPNSDVDIQIIFKNNVKWALFNKKRYGIRIDFEVVGKKDFLKYSKKYPYLYYSHNDKILLDKEGVIKRVFNRLRKYFKENKEVKTFWETEYKKMRIRKNKGLRPKHFADICDEAELKFSEDKAAKRKIWTKEWFHKHIKK